MSTYIVTGDPVKLTQDEPDNLLWVCLPSIPSQRSDIAKFEKSPYLTVSQC